jgi:hypothetical protein
MSPKPREARRGQKWTDDAASGPSGPIQGEKRPRRPPAKLATGFGVSGCQADYVARHGGVAVDERKRRTAGPSARGERPRRWALGLRPVQPGVIRSPLDRDGCEGEIPARRDGNKQRALQRAPVGQKGLPFQGSFTQCSPLANATEARRGGTDSRRPPPHTCATAGYVSTRSTAWPASSCARPGGACSMSFRFERPTKSGSRRRGRRWVRPPRLGSSCLSRLSACKGFLMLSKYPPWLARQLRSHRYFRTGTAPRSTTRSPRPRRLRAPVGYADRRAGGTGTPPRRYGPTA